MEQYVFMSRIDAVIFGALILLIGVIIGYYMHDD